MKHFLCLSVSFVSMPHGLGMYTAAVNCIKTLPWETNSASFYFLSFPLAFIQFSTIIAKISFAKAATMTTKILLIFLQERDDSWFENYPHTHTDTHKKISSEEGEGRKCELISFNGIV